MQQEKPQPIIVPLSGSTAGKGSAGGQPVRPAPEPKK